MKLTVKEASLSLLIVLICASCSAGRVKDRQPAEDSTNSIAGVWLSSWRSGLRPLRNQKIPEEILRIREDGEIEYLMGRDGWGNDLKTMKFTRVSDHEVVGKDNAIEAHFMEIDKDHLQRDDAFNYIRLDEKQLSEKNAALSNRLQGRWILTKSTQEDGINPGPWSFPMVTDAEKHDHGNEVSPVEIVFKPNGKADINGVSYEWFIMAATEKAGIQFEASDPSHAYDLIGSDIGMLRGIVSELTETSLVLTVEDAQMVEHHFYRKADMKSPENQ